MNLKELKEKIKNVDTSYNNNKEKIYHDLYNACIDYQNILQDWQFEDLFEEIVDYEIAEQRAKYELEQCGLLRLHYFLGDTQFYMEEIFRINAYGNLENVIHKDLQVLQDDILERIKELEESES